RSDSRDVVAATHFTFLREHASSFEEAAALAHYSETGLDLVTAGGATRLRVLRVSNGYFATLRARLPFGRGFDADDETGARRVVLSDALWRTHFGADPKVVGTTVQLSAESYEQGRCCSALARDPGVRHRALEPARPAGQRRSPRAGNIPRVVAAGASRCADGPATGHAGRQLTRARQARTTARILRRPPRACHHAAGSPVSHTARSLPSASPA